MILCYIMISTNMAISAELYTIRERLSDIMANGQYFAYDDNEYHYIGSRMHYNSITYLLNNVNYIGSELITDDIILNSVREYMKNNQEYGLYHRTFDISNYRRNQ
jgi:hypothetical protein